MATGLEWPEMKKQILEVINRLKELERQLTNVAQKEELKQVTQILITVSATDPGGDPGTITDHPHQ